MTRIAPVRLQYNPKVLWFDPNGLDISDGDAVIVKTERGLEFGHALEPIDVGEEELSNLKTSLKPVMRMADERDLDEVEELRRKGEEALPVFKRLAAEDNDTMKPVMVEYLFGGDKAVFFFESEERVDFRNLVKRLSSELGVRVDMRQIGVRDEARLVGGLGHCGQELCCKRLGGEFNPVSIRMAKEQDLSLNPAKISGVCGRLMCCLRYEFDAYKEFHGRAPKVNAKIDTPAGCCKVCDLNVPRETVTVVVEEDGKKVTFPLSAMDEPEEGKRPSSIGEAFDEYANPDPFAGTQFSTFDTAGFTQDSTLAKPEAHHNPSSATDEDKPQKKRRRRRRSGQANAGKGGEAGKEQKSQQAQAEGGQKKRRRRRSGSGQQSGQKPSARPGQKSSSLHATGEASRPSSSKRQQPTGETAHRKARKRSHRSGTSEAKEKSNES